MAYGADNPATTGRVLGVLGIVQDAQREELDFLRHAVRLRQLGGVRLALGGIDRHGAALQGDRRPLKVDAVGHGELGGLRLIPRGGGDDDLLVIEQETAVDNRPAGFGVIGDCGDGFGLAEQEADHVDVVDVQIHDGAAAAVGIVIPTLKAPARHGTQTVEEGVLDLAECSLLNGVLEEQIQRFEAQALTDHQLFAASLSGGDHLLTVGGGQRHAGRTAGRCRPCRILPSRSSHQGRCTASDPTGRIWGCPRG